ncbi:type II secretion system F family protein [Xenophilus arseniciresistens]|uniref:Type II secretion system F family protein n=1 Tax=Xenophilus arseniciresistens TaxID=1283306 RepID=A0AAE3T0F9_9BURK|nr:type II secretion system F family protein [Xenophilus arseniciresistens]MDA7418172.1 type II secretion system F family protein [Xenophilus arseniciresistens]
MSERLLVVLALALLLAAAGLWLWHLSARGRERAAVGAHLERQLRMPAGGAAEAPAPWMREPAQFLDEAAGAMPQDGQGGARGQGLAGISLALPGWLAGAVKPATLLLGVVAAALVTMGASFALGPVAAVAAAVLCAVFGLFLIWLAVQRFRRTLVRQLPTFIDAMVRLITIGNSTHAAFQLSIPSAGEPLRGYLEKASSLVRGGVELDQALHQMARTVRIEEMYLLAAILGLGVRYGGRADLLLERVANFMRDREQAEQELTALSAETRLSAWILGLLPVAVGLAIVMLNAAYFMRMWQDDSGRMMIYGAAGLQVAGALMLYRLARLS